MDPLGESSPPTTVNPRLFRPGPFSKVTFLMLKLAWLLRLWRGRVQNLELSITFSSKSVAASVFFSWSRLGGSWQLPLLRAASLKSIFLLGREAPACREALGLGTGRGGRWPCGEGRGGRGGGWSPGPEAE